MIRIIVTLANHVSVINLIVCSSYMIKLSKNMGLKKLDKRWESFSPTTDNFLAFFIVFEWGRILESPIDKQEVKSNAELRRNDFSVNVSVQTVVFRRQFSKNWQF